MLFSFKNKGGKHVIKVLLVDSDRGRGAVIAQALLDSDMGCDIFRPDLEANLIKTVESYHPDVIIIEVDAPSRDTLEHLAIINELNPKPVVMFAENDDSNLIRKAIQSGVSAYVVDGVAQNRIKSILEVAIARFREYQALKDELAQTKHQLADRKLIEKAKGFLMKQAGIDEDTAFKQLRKLAMDKGKPLAEIAANVVSVAELLS